MHHPRLAVTRLLALGCLLFGSSPGFAEDLLFRCESQRDSYTLCRLDKPVDGVIVLHRQLSSADCVYQETWGHNAQGIWVDKGCRAEFTARASAHQGENDPLGTMVITETLEQPTPKEDTPATKLEVGADYARPAIPEEHNPLVDTWQHNRSLPSILRITF